MVVLAEAGIVVEGVEVGGSWGAVCSCVDETAVGHWVRAYLGILLPYVRD